MTSCSSRAPLVLGGAVGQIAKALGASRVIGSAGSAEKVRHVVEDLGFDAAFDYKAGPVSKQRATSPPTASTSTSTTSAVTTSRLLSARSGSVDGSRSAG